MHESEKEVKRLENEQSQLPTTTTTNPNDKQQPQTVPTPAFLNGFTLEKLDNNEIRRFVSISKRKILFLNSFSFHRVNHH